MCSHTPEAGSPLVCSAYLPRRAALNENIFGNVKPNTTEQFPGPLLKILVPGAQKNRGAQRADPIDFFLLLGERGKATFHLRGGPQNSNEASSLFLSPPHL